MWKPDLHAGGCDEPRIPRRVPEQAHLREPYVGVEGQALQACRLVLEWWDAADRGGVPAVVTMPGEYEPGSGPRALFGGREPAFVAAARRALVSAGELAAQ